MVIFFLEIAKKTTAILSQYCIIIVLVSKQREMVQRMSNMISKAYYHSWQYLKKIIPTTDYSIISSTQFFISQNKKVCAQLTHGGSETSEKQPTRDLLNREYKILHNIFYLVRSYTFMRLFLHRDEFQFHRASNQTDSKEVLLNTFRFRLYINQQTFKNTRI